MNRSSPRSSYLAALLLLLYLLTASIPGATLARTVASPAPTTASAPSLQSPAPPPPTQPPLQDLRALVPGGGALTANDELVSPAENRATAPKPQPAAVRPAAPPADLPAAAPSISPAGIQGVVTLNVLVPATIRAGEYITYTYAYTNTDTTQSHSVVVEGVWPYAVDNSGNVEFCGPDLCDVLAGSVQGPAVTRQPVLPNATSIRYTVGAPLAANAKGRFSVRLRSHIATYPAIIKSITRPSGSGNLYKDGGQIPISQDTASTLVVGPILVPSKAAATVGSLYPVIETGTFTITVLNATRADSRPATNVVVRDGIPSGGAFVSTTAATGTYTVSGGMFIWNVGGLAVGQSAQTTVTFKKLDVHSECFTLSNSYYLARSNEYPIGGTQDVQGSGANITVVPTLKIAGIAIVPSSPIFGDQASVTIAVENYWNQDLTGVKLNYDLQNNAYYMPGSATSDAPGAVVSAAPDPSTPGGRLSWTFNMPKGSKSTPSTALFSLTVRGGYVYASQNAVTQLIPPAGVPSACVDPRYDSVGFGARLGYWKSTDADPQTLLNGCYIVRRGDIFKYIINVQNKGATDVSGITIHDTPPALFTYVANSAQVGGQAWPPSSVSSGAIDWSGAQSLTAPANSTMQLSYQMKIEDSAIDYYEYWNHVSATFPNDEPHGVGTTNLCVKINPNIRVTKTILSQPSTPKPGDQVKFRMTLTNYEPNAYDVGLYDNLNQFQFVSFDGGNAGAPTADTTCSVFGICNGLKWPIQHLISGQQVTADITAKIPTACVTGDYANEVLFRQDTASGIQGVRPAPQVAVSVHSTCGKIEYAQEVDRDNVGLGDRILYTLHIHDADANPYSNLAVDEYLPQGFTFVGIDSSSDIKTAPTQQQQLDGKTKLSWTIPSIASGQEIRIKIIVRAGSVVGPYQAWLSLGQNALCLGSCFSTPEGVTYNRMIVTVQPLITAEPSLTPNTCALPGQIRTYKVAIINSNAHNYASTGVTVTLPLGLKFVSTVADTPSPSVTTDSLGVTTVAWKSLTILTSSPFYEKDLQINLQIGQVWGDLGTSIETTSPDGLIPLKDGATNVSVTVCPPGPAIAKDVTRSSVQVGDEIVYQISLANPTASPINTTVIDQLPTGLSYVGMVPGKGANPGGTSPLTWNVTIPAAANGRPGSLILQFRVHVDSGNLGTVYTNTATSSPAALDTTYASVVVVIPGYAYLPFVVR